MIIPAKKEIPFQQSFKIFIKDHTVGDPYKSLAKFSDTSPCLHVRLYIEEPLTIDLQLKRNTMCCLHYQPKLA